LFSCQQITDKGLYCLVEGLKKQKNLESLTLILERHPFILRSFFSYILLLSCCQISDAGFRKVNEAFKELKYLEYLNLNFSW